jgi:hypothetical protein
MNKIKFTITDLSFLNNLSVINKKDVYNEIYDKFLTNEPKTFDYMYDNHKNIFEYIDNKFDIKNTTIYDYILKLKDTLSKSLNTIPNINYDNIVYSPFGIDCLKEFYPEVNDDDYVDDDILHKIELSINYKIESLKDNKF